jgi:hypothetical protein
MVLRIGDIDERSDTESERTRYFFPVYTATVSYLKLVSHTRDTCRIKAYGSLSSVWVEE